jgi:hypothetical protein
LDAVYTSSDVWAYPTATFTDSVVYRISGGPNAGQWQATYETASDGTITLGEAERVNMVEQVVPAAGKTDKAGEKAGRTLSAANATAIRAALQSMQDALEKLEAVTGVDDSDDTAASEDGKTQTAEPAEMDEDPEAKEQSEEPTGKSGKPMLTVPVESLDAELQLLGLAALPQP